MKITKDGKYRKIAIIVLIPLIFISQYYLFKYGILRPMLKGVEIQIVEGEYISDIDKYVVKVDDRLKLDMGDYIKLPSYAKSPNLILKVLDDNKIVNIEKDGNQFNMNTLKEGFTSIGVMNGPNLLRKVTIRVVNPKVEMLEMELEDNLVYVGDNSKINATVETDYKDFEEPNIEFESSNGKVLHIEDNKIEAVGVGTATIYAKSGDKVDTKTFNIRAKVANIDIANKIELEEGQVLKLSPNIITSPKGLKHPKTEYSLVGSKLSVSRSISLKNDGTITGIREGEEEIKITCGNKSKVITIKVNKKSIKDKFIENLIVTREVIENTMILTLTWDHVESTKEYAVYLRNNSLDEKEFKVVKNVPVNEDYLELSNKIQTKIEVDISEIENIDIDLYVVGLNDYEETKPSNMVKIEYSKDNESINNLTGYFDKDTNGVRVSWDPINAEGVTYSVYVRNILQNEENFTVYNQDITSNECIINITEDIVELEVYVSASYNGKTIISNTILIK